MNNNMPNPGIGKKKLIQFIHLSKHNRNYKSSDNLEYIFFPRDSLLLKDTDSIFAFVLSFLPGCSLLCFLNYL